jgi:hypothetical protein
MSSSTQRKQSARQYSACQGTGLADSIKTIHRRNAIKGMLALGGSFLAKLIISQEVMDLSTPNHRERLRLSLKSRQEGPEHKSISARPLSKILRQRHRSAIAVMPPDAKTLGERSSEDRFSRGFFYIFKLSKITHL